MPQLSPQREKCPVAAHGPAAPGEWNIDELSAAHEVLHADTRQAGFQADIVWRLFGLTRITPSVLYLYGDRHLEHRKLTARSFWPKTVTGHYVEFIEQTARTTTDLVRRGPVDLSSVTMEMAVAVGTTIVGLTDSKRRRGLTRRLEAIFRAELVLPTWRPRSVVAFARTLSGITKLFFLDVRPAIRRRKGDPQEDLISLLVSRNVPAKEILSECITYATASMVTTREFMCIAAWHLLTDSALREQFLAGDEPARLAFLRELLRVEPVISHISRYAETDIDLELRGEKVTVPSGSLIHIHVHDINLDESVVGSCPDAIRHGRTLAGVRTPTEVLSFGDGRHRCPGEYIAIQETDAFLRHLLALPGVRIVTEPEVGWSELTRGYELRNFLVTADPA